MFTAIAIITLRDNVTFFITRVNNLGPYLLHQYSVNNLYKGLQQKAVRKIYVVSLI